MNYLSKGHAMRSTTTTCDRCGSVVLENPSAFEAKHGPLTQRLDGPVDLCPICQDRLLDWLRGGRQAVHAVGGGIRIVAPTVEGFAARQALRHGA